MSIDWRTNVYEDGGRKYSVGCDHCAHSLIYSGLLLN